MDWQTIIAVGIVLGAAWVVGRRLVQTFTATEAHGCGGGCAACPSADQSRSVHAHSEPETLVALEFDAFHPVVDAHSPSADR